MAKYKSKKNEVAEPEKNKADFAKSIMDLYSKPSRVEPEPKQKPGRRKFKDEFGIYGEMADGADMISS